MGSVEVEQWVAQELEVLGVVATLNSRLNVNVVVHLSNNVQVGDIMSLGSRPNVGVVVKLASKVDVRVVVVLGIHSSKVDVGHGVTCAWSWKVRSYYSLAAE